MHPSGIFMAAPRNFSASSLPARVTSSLPARVFERSLSGRPLCADGAPLLPACPAERVHPVIADPPCSVLGTVLLGFSADGDRLISYSHAPCGSAAADSDSVWGQCWLFSPGEPLVLLCEAPLFSMPQEAPGSAPSEMVLSCFEAAAGSTLVYHAAYRVASTDEADATGAGTRRFESLCIVRSETGTPPAPMERGLRPDRYVQYADVETHGPFFASSWSLRYVPSLEMLMWNVGDGVYRFDLAARALESGGCWSGKSTSLPGPAFRAGVRCSHFDLELWLPAVLSRLQLTHLRAHDYSLLPVEDVADEEGRRVLLMLLYLQLHPRPPTDGPREGEEAAPASASERVAPLPPEARRTALCVVLTAALEGKGALRVLHVEKAPVEAPANWLRAKLLLTQREMPPTRSSARGPCVAHSLAASASVLSNASVASGRSLSSLSHPTLPLAVAGFRRQKGPPAPPRSEATAQGGWCAQS